MPARPSPPPCCAPVYCAPVCCPQPCCPPACAPQPCCATWGGYGGYSCAAPAWGRSAVSYIAPAAPQAVSPSAPAAVYEAAPSASNCYYAPVVPVYAGYQGGTHWLGY